VTECVVGVRHVDGGDESCVGTSNEVTLSDPEDCVALGDGAAQAAADPTSHGCDASFAGAPQLGTPTLSTVLTVCGSTVDAGDGCEADACLPRPPSIQNSTARICVMQNGKAAGCPEGYPERVDAGTSFVDARDCAACTCADFSCGGTVSVFTDAICESCDELAAPCAAAMTVDGEEQCTGLIDPGEGGAFYAKWLDADPTCTPSTSAVTGEVELVDPVTLCCQR
jgi:hypothetical protein